MASETMRDKTLSIVGLGYVGLPVAVAFAAAGYKVSGFDINEQRVSELRDGLDRTGSVTATDLASRNLLISDKDTALNDIDIHIVTVPTPVDAAKRPDLTPVIRAAETVGRHLKPGAIVVFESTVYPGATEDVAVPVLERESGLTFGRDFEVGYSPERINPGDDAHDFTTILKIVSASTPQTTELLAALYGSVVTAGIHKAPSIRVAEAAKVIENTQRDLNIALMNELSVMFHALDIDTRDVLEAAGTKWNFLKFQPGLVGGHCIGVDPYYLTHKAHEIGHTPQVVLAGRGTNEQMPRFVATSLIQACARLAFTMPLTVTVLGVTYKANVPDARNSKVADLVHELERYGARVQTVDPLADPDQTRAEHALELTNLNDVAPADAVVVAVPHSDYGDNALDWAFVRSLLRSGNGFVSDLTGTLSRDEKPDAITLWRL